MQLSTGDKAILVGAAAIVGYELWVQDDDELISRRVAAYRAFKVRTRSREIPLGRILADTVIFATALHLCETLPPRWDIYHYAMLAVRKPQHVRQAA